MDDDTIGTQTAVSGITNVSPQSHNSASNVWFGQRHVRQWLGIEDPVLSSIYNKTAEAEKIEELVREIQHCKQEMEQMMMDLKTLNDSIEILTVKKR